MSPIKLGFAGIGRMGNPMARRLLAAGHDVTVFDASADAMVRLAEAGAGKAATPAELAETADIVFMSLPTPDIVEVVALGGNGLVRGKRARIVVDLSTTGPQMARRLGEGLAAAGKQAVDCPVSGGVGGAEAGKLALMAACPKPTFEEVASLLAEFGRTFHVGEEPGMGQMIKVINNLMSVTALAISSEALVLGAKAGLDPDVMLEVINAGSGRNAASTDKVPKFVLNRGFDFGFAIGLSAKDARLCLDESEALGVPMIVGSAVRQLITITKGRLGPDADLTEIIKPIEEWAGVTVEGKAAREAKA